MAIYSDVLLKLAAILTLIVLAALGGWAAQRLGGPEEGSRRYTGNANAVPGGFLLGAALFHFMPESHRHFELLFPHHVFPYGFVACAVGFTLILGVERMMFDPEAHLLEDSGKRSAAPVRRHPPGVLPPACELAGDVAIRQWAVGDAGGSPHRLKTRGRRMVPGNVLDWRRYIGPRWKAGMRILQEQNWPCPALAGSLSTA